MTLEAPQIILLVLTAFGAGSAASKFGRRKDDVYDIVDVLVAPALLIALLWWGGFFG